MPKKSHLKPAAPADEQQDKAVEKFLALVARLIAREHLRRCIETDRQGSQAPESDRPDADKS